jgi:hypothetical protein
MIVILESDLESDDETRDEMLARVPCDPPPLVEYIQLRMHILMG